MLASLSMDDHDRTARLRERRREHRRRQVRRRRAVALAVLLAVVAGITLGARSVGGSSSKSVPVAAVAKAPEPKKHSDHVRLPREIRGVHVTMSLASLPGKLQQYLALPGLNTIELDVKDESGHVSGPYYDARRAARDVHARGDYLIGRVVTFEDPVLS